MLDTDSFDINLYEWEWSTDPSEENKCHIIDHAKNDRFV